MDPQSTAPQRQPRKSSRREFLKRGGEVAAGATLAASLVVPRVHAGEDNEIRLALIGCGGRGSGAVRDALSVAQVPVKLYAMADIFAERLQSKQEILGSRFDARIDVPPERQFVGFDAYRHAIDCLRPGDIAMLTAYAYSRPTHLEYAVEKGVNVFMEKPFAPDPAGLQRMLHAGRLAEQKNLKIAAGLMCRHSVSRQALMNKIADGELGEIQLIRSYRMSGDSRLNRRRPDQDELIWQMRNNGHFFWITSGRYVEWLIHQIDECCWLKNAWPVSAEGFGGQVADHNSCSQNLDLYSVEYTFADGTKAMVTYRAMPDCRTEFATYVHGTKRAAQFSGMTHRATVHTFKDQRVDEQLADWSPPGESETPWQAEWRVLLDSIRQDRTQNETERAVMSDMASIMGRAAVHTGQIVTWEQMMSSQFQFCPDVDRLDFGGVPPVHDDADGRYPVPIPGKWVET
jgi:predicted dehydrogenase